MNKLFYHFYCCENSKVWTEILDEQVSLILTSNLVHNLSKIDVSVIVRTQEDVEKAIDEFGKHKIKMNLEFIRNPFETDKQMMESLDGDQTITENYTMKKIYAEVFNDPSKCNIGYIHSKGITSHLKDDDYGQQRYKLWRQFLNWGVIENWEKCINALDTHDIAGANYFDYPAKHYSGNFWWATSDYIRRLPDPSTTYWWKTLQASATDYWLRNCSDRFRDEQWPCNLSGAKIFNLYTPPENPANRTTPREEYVHKA